MRKTKNTITTDTKSKPSSIKLKDGFIVTDFIVASNIDYVYAEEDGNFKLLNLNILGTTSSDVVIDLIETGSSVAIINGLNMDVYNLDESVLKDALINM